MTEPLRIPRRIVDEMVAHCISERPNEACGVIATNGSELVELYAMTNEAASPVRYKLVPLEYKKVIDELYARGLDVGAAYHSHTHTDASPSPTDVREAHEDIPYVIVSLMDEDPDIRAFRIVKVNWFDEEGEVVEVPVEISG